MANSRSNGSKASNKGKLKSEPIAIININYGARSAAGGITFKKVLRAQLLPQAREVPGRAEGRGAAQCCRARGVGPLPAWVWAREAGRYAV